MTSSINHDLPLEFIPFVLAATGHRDLCPEDLPMLREKVTGVIGRLRKRMPSTPILLLSALAEGADQLVAGAALDAGARLAVILPMPVDIYRQTMPDSARAIFDSLMPRASLVINLDLVASPDDLGRSEDARKLQYHELARYLASHCQALIALWDGMDFNQEGGTYEVVRSVLVGVDHKDLIEPPRGTVIHIVTRRTRHGAALPDAGNVHVLRYHDPFEPNGVVWQRTVNQLPADDATDFDALARAATSKDIANWRLRLTGWRDIVAGRQSTPDGPLSAWRERQGRNWIERSPTEVPIDSFNRRSARLGEGGKSIYRLQPQKWGGNPWPFLTRIEECWRRADVLAMVHQRRRSTFLFGMIVAIGLAAVGLETHTNLMPGENLLWLAFPLTIGFALVLYRISRLLKVENWFLDSRALAEGMRVQYFWELGGVREDVWEHYLAHRTSELGWVVPAMRGLALFRHEQPQPPAVSNLDIQAALDGWVDDQKRYYARKSRSQRATLEKLERISNFVLGAVFCVTVVVAIIALSSWPWLECPRHLIERGHSWIHWGIPVVTAVAGVMKVWLEQSGYDEQSRNYRRMGHLFSHRGKVVKRHMADNAPAAAIAELHELGVKALEENSIWLIMHRDHPLKVAHGG